MAIAKVVLVEDEKNPSTEFRAQLKKEGFEVTACVGGFDALDELGQHFRYFHQNRKHWWLLEW